MRLSKEMLRRIIQEEIQLAKQDLQDLQEYEEVNDDKTEDGLGREKHKATPKTGTVNSYLMHTELEEVRNKKGK